MKKILGSIILVFILSGAYLSQNEFHLSQYMVHQPFINPGSVGAFENLNGAVFYRTQWTGFDGAPKVSGFNINSPVGNEQNNIGLTLVNDKVGVNNVTDLSLNYGYTMQTSLKTKLSFGLSGSLKMLQNNYTAVETNGIEDPSFQANSPTLLMPNFKFGTYFNSRKFYLGFAIPNLLYNDSGLVGAAAKTTFDVTQMHFYLHSGYKFKMNKNFDLNLSTLIKQVSGAPIQSDINLLAEYQKKFGIGVSYRTSKEIAALLQFRINPAFKLAYSYDLTLSKLGTYSNGSHEIMLVFDVKNSSKYIIIEAPRF